MTEFADLHQPGKPLFLPNAWDFASAAELVRAGYTTIGTTSLGVAAAAGKPDSSGVAAAETLAVTKLLARLPIMLTVDFEAGHSDDPAEVADLATQLAEAGAVGVNLEDSRPDLTLDDPARHAAKIAAIKAAVPDLFVNARTDTFWLSDHSAPPPVDETLRRASAYIDAGADGIFVPGAADIPTVGALTSAIKAPVNVLYLSGQHTFGELAEAGVARVSTGSLLFRTALGAAIETARAAHHGTVPPNPHRPTYEDIQGALTGHQHRAGDADRSGIEKRRPRAAPSVVHVRHTDDTRGATMTGSSTQGAKTLLHPVTDLEKSKAVYAALLGVAPTADSAYYVGFDAEGQHIGLVPGGGPQKMTSPIAYWHVADIAAKLAEVTEAGATVREQPHEVGGGRQVATFTDLDGNVLGLVQD